MPNNPFTDVQLMFYQKKYEKNFKDSSDSSDEEDSENNNNK